RPCDPLKLNWRETRASEWLAYLRGVAMRSTKVLFWLAQLAGVAATVWFLWGSEIPLGVPGEWTWDRITFGKEAVKEATFGGVIARIAAVVYLVFCLFPDH